MLPNAELPANSATEPPLVRVLSAAVLVLVLEAMFFEYENEYRVRVRS